MNLEFDKQLPTPAVIKELYSLSSESEESIACRRALISDVFTGASDRIVLVIGPCSADNEGSVLDYISRLAGLQELVAECIVIVPRIYTNKPRTTGKGYKGLVHQPNPLGEPDAFAGVIATRKLHLRAVAETGLVSADEMLYPQNLQFLDDVLGYVAVGARSVEDQEHRLAASAIEVPTGMKNPTSGDLSVMMNSITAAQCAHDFIYRGWSVRSAGNPLAHAILRGFTDEDGGIYSNYHYENLVHLAALYAERPELANPGVVVDCNHSNSRKDPLEQPRIARDVVASCKANADVAGLVKGFMVESYIEDGAQPVGGGVYGKSITDACLGWEKTERFVLELAEML